MRGMQPAPGGGIGLTRMASVSQAIIIDEDCFKMLKLEIDPPKITVAHSMEALPYKS